MVSGAIREGKMPLNGMFNELAFKKRNARIDWRKIAGLDLDKIVREMDVETLQDNIDHITFCNIETEIDTRMMDPNYVKLFRISQYIIEYLIHSQNYLTDIIGSIENQSSSVILEKDELKRSNEKLQKDLVEVKKENKRRKKMIETQQTLMSVTSSNYHQCAYCSKVFLNVSYLQAHMSRRHPDVNFNENYKISSEIEKELKLIKERLRSTEEELLMEKKARLTTVTTNYNTNDQTMLKQIEESKNNEIKRLKEEIRKIKTSLNKELHDITEENSRLQANVKSLEERLGKQSHVGWIKDDIDLEKDQALKLKEENRKLTEMVENYKLQIEEQKSEWNKKENHLKHKYAKELSEKDKEIALLRARLEELQNSIGKNENELVIRLDRLKMDLEEERQLRFQLENELNESRKQPPKVTPRKPQETPRSPSPPKITTHPTQAPVDQSLIYLPDYCPLTLKAVQANPKHLEQFRKYAEQMLNENLEEVGIEKNEKGLSNNDFKLVMKNIKEIRQDRADDMTEFKELRREFAQLSSKYSSQKLNSSLRSSAANRVTFKNDVSSNVTNRPAQNSDPKSQRPHQQQHINHHHHHPYQNQPNTSLTQQERSEETDDDVSLSNALESNEDDTEPTKSPINENQRGDTYRNRELQASPRKIAKMSGNMNPDEISDLESISQLLSDRSASRKKERIAGKNSTVSETKRKIEKQIEANSKRANPPAPNAVPIGFFNEQKNAKEEESFSSISDINDQKPNKPKSGMRSSIPDSVSSSVWVNDSNSNNPNHKDERPATANSSKTFLDSDEIENLE